jgi:hypothetical protein
VITTLLLPFQKLKEQKMIENAPIGAPSEDPVEEVVDIEIASIASENLVTFEGLGATETILRETSGDADQEGGAEV